MKDRVAVVVRRWVWWLVGEVGWVGGVWSVRVGGWRDGKGYMRWRRWRGDDDLSKSGGAAGRGCAFRLWHPCHLRPSIINREIV